ncbi:hypothetical protein NCCP2222_31960 [Sporosarcina sp. NCCP-2222]|uniref:serine hydrolase domain-containing protein n=1 Tax=Sporosarcina sp. NCCP-2222 TaxID=2935073 RepID=UPI00208C288B|nr:hypothetical protein NCCP2222_31960 [Sporosarcina sp. NCCP-2222]
MKFKVGERFHYNNAGYILLGLIIEKASKRSFAEYVQEFVLKKAGMADSGYFELDALPTNTALGYIDYPDGTWKTNSYSLPVKGGPDGGAYVSVGDMAMLWGALLDNRLLSEEYTQLLLSPHVAIEGDDYYGYGVWIKKNGSDILKYHVMGYDPGVSFHSAYYPTSSTIVVVCSNQSEGAYEVLQEMEEKIGLLK